MSRATAMHAKRRRISTGLQQKVPCTNRRLLQRVDAAGTRQLVYRSVSVATRHSFWQSVFVKDVVTIAELLQRRGYATAAFTTNDWVNERFGFDRGFETFRWSKRTMEWLKSLFSAETKAEKVIRYARDPFYPVGHRNNKLIKAWIKQSRQTGRPFFALHTLF